MKIKIEKLGRSQHHTVVSRLASSQHISIHVISKISRSIGHRTHVLGFKGLKTQGCDATPYGHVSQSHLHFRLHEP